MQDLMEGSVHPSTITLSENSLLVTPEGSSQPYVLARKNSSGGSGGGGGGTGTTIDTLNKVYISGNTYSRKTYSFNLPSGVKSMTIKTLPVNASNLNFADLFVRYNSLPVVNHNPPTNYSYTWTADCASTLSNNAVETCTFSSPQSGTWNVLLYGYNNNFECYLAVIIER